MFWKEKRHVPCMKVFAALRDDSHQGWVWLQKPELQARSVVKITNCATGKSVYCEALQIDTNFLSEYNQSSRFSITDPSASIVLSYWYRAALGGIETQLDLAFIVKPANCLWGRFRACTHHPQLVVRVAVWLGLVGVILGFFGVLLGIASLWPALR